MKFVEIDNFAMEFHEEQITINTSERYAEIIEVYRTSKDGPGFVIVTSIKVIEPQPDKKQDITEDLRRFEL